MRLKVIKMADAWCKECKQNLEEEKYNDWTYCPYCGNTLVIDYH